MTGRPLWILTQTNWIWAQTHWYSLLKLDDVSHLANLPSWIPSHFAHKKTSVIHSDSTLWWQPSWFLPFRIHPICTKKLHSFILTQLDDGCHLEFYHLGFRHCNLAFKKTCHLHSDSDSTWGLAAPLWILTQTNSIWFKLIHSCLSWWCQTPWNLPSWIQPFWTQKHSHSFTLTQLHDGSQLEFYHLGFSHFTQNKLHSFITDSTWRCQPSWNLPSWIQPFWTKKTSLIHSDSTWRWQPSSFLPC